MARPDLLESRRLARRQDQRDDDLARAASETECAELIDHLLGSSDLP